MVSFLNRCHFFSSFRFRAKMSARYKDFPFTSCPYMNSLPRYPKVIAFPVSSAFHLMLGHSGQTSYTPHQWWWWWDGGTSENMTSDKQCTVQKQNSTK